jgi:hypothetical protein
MTLVISKGITLAKANNGIVDPDAIIYINNVEKADGENLEYDTAKAIHDFVVGCKADGIWNAIKASCILAGARTLTGALIPLVGTAPTNFNFVAGDYNRKTGLVGDGSTKYLNSNRAGNADPLNNKHCSVYASSLDSTALKPYIGANRNSSNETTPVLIYTTLTRLHDSATSFYTAITGFIGISRAESSSYIRRNGLANTTLNQPSVAMFASNSLIYADRLVNSPLYLDARLAFYSIGESLDLALLDARVTDLINAFGAAIP